jgi:hypothetical protein
VLRIETRMAQINDRWDLGFYDGGLRQTFGLLSGVELSMFQSFHKIGSDNQKHSHFKAPLPKLRSYTAHRRVQSLAHEHQLMLTQGSLFGAKLSPTWLFPTTSTRPSRP